MGGRKRRKEIPMQHKSREWLYRKKRLKMTSLSKDLITKLMINSSSTHSKQRIVQESADANSQVSLVQRRHVDWNQSWCVSTTVLSVTCNDSGRITISVCTFCASWFDQNNAIWTMGNRISNLLVKNTLSVAKIWVQPYLFVMNQNHWQL